MDPPWFWNCDRAAFGMVASECIQVFKDNIRPDASGMWLEMGSLEAVVVDSDIDADGFRETRHVGESWSLVEF
jgi:hypothetical protein